MLKWPEDFLNRIIQGDCLEVMKQMPDKCVDLVLTDPPYGMNFISNHRTQKHQGITGDDKQFPVEALTECFRLARGAVYCFCRWDNLRELPTPKSVIAWIKNNWSMGDLHHEHGRQWEAICFYPQESHEFVKRIPDVIDFRRAGNNNHPTEKPVKLLQKIIKANVGQTVFDPFLGSGTTAIAAAQLGRKFIGVEISEAYVEIARERLKRETQQTNMFLPKRRDKARITWGNCID